MITTKSDRDRYFAADLMRSGVARWWPWSGIRYPILRFQRQLRHTEYVVNCRGKGAFSKVRRLICLFRLRKAGMRLGFTIHPNVFGPGLCIVHWGTLVVNPNVRVGANCRIHPGTSLGDTKGGSPMLGEDCYIGPGAKLFGPIVLGDRVQIGANAVVNKSFESDAVLVGIPARDVSSSGSGSGPGTCSVPRLGRSL